MGGTGGNQIQRGIDFEKGAAESTLRVIDLETGEESRSEPALEAFRSGLWKYLGITVKQDGFRLIDPEIDSSQVDEIGKSFEASFTTQRVVSSKGRLQAAR